MLVLEFMEVSNSEACPPAAFPVTQYPLTTFFATLYNCMVDANMLQRSPAGVGML